MKDNPWLPCFERFEEWGVADDVISPRGSFEIELITPSPKLGMHGLDERIFLEVRSSDCLNEATRSNKFAKVFGEVFFLEHAPA